jgi:hypothetical protein
MMLMTGIEQSTSFALLYRSACRHVTDSGIIRLFSLLLPARPGVKGDKFRLLSEPDTFN